MVAETWLARGTRKGRICTAYAEGGVGKVQEYASLQNGCKLHAGVYQHHLGAVDILVQVQAEVG